MAFEKEEDQKAFDHDHRPEDFRIQGKGKEIHNQGGVIDKKDHTLLNACLRLHMGKKKEAFCDLIASFVRKDIRDKEDKKDFRQWPSQGRARFHPSFRTISKSIGFSFQGNRSWICALG